MEAYNISYRWIKQLLYVFFYQQFVRCILVRLYEYRLHCWIILSYLHIIQNLSHLYINIYTLFNYNVESIRYTPCIIFLDFLKFNGCVRILMDAEYSCHYTNSLIPYQIRNGNVLLESPSEDPRLTPAGPRLSTAPTGGGRENQRLPPATRRSQGTAMQTPASKHKRTNASHQQQDALKAQRCKHLQVNPREPTDQQQDALQAQRRAPASKQERTNALPVNKAPCDANTCMFCNKFISRRQLSTFILF